MNDPLKELVGRVDAERERRQILDAVDEAVRFTLHAMCLAPIGDGQAGDRAAKMIVARVAQRMTEVPQKSRKSPAKVPQKQ